MVLVNTVQKLLGIQIQCSRGRGYAVRTHYIVHSAKTSWLFQQQSVYLGCIQAEETVVMRGLLWY